MRQARLSAAQAAALEAGVDAARRRRSGGQAACHLAVLACGLVCYLVSVLHLFRAHAPPPRYPVGARTAAKMLSHAYDDDGKPKPKPSIIRPPQPKQPQPPADTCDTKRWRNDTDLKGGDLKGGMRAASSPAACCALCLEPDLAWRHLRWLKGRRADAGKLASSRVHTEPETAAAPTASPWVDDAAGAEEPQQPYACTRPARSSMASASSPSTPALG